MSFAAVIASIPVNSKNQSNPPRKMKPQNESAEWPAEILTADRTF
jgi:hypothetical protein